MSKTERSSKTPKLSPEALIAKQAFRWGQNCMPSAKIGEEVRELNKTLFPQNQNKQTDQQKGGR